ncbi:CcdB antidote CcdA [gamma proteobacterium HdN1]|nr:CcdB antidote CcdA [gamma proteobacterium HdN1]
MRIDYAENMRMNPAFDTQAPKKPTNVTINSDLLAKAKELKINLSATLEAALIELVNAKQRELWKRENKTAIEAYNQLVDEHGTFSDELRSF